MSKVTLTIDGLDVEAEKETTILRAALDNDIYIPHLCYHPELSPSGICRLCMVNADGEVVMSCQTPVDQGMVVKTKDPEIDRLRRTSIEILVANHHASCRGCPGSGPCALQKIMAYIRIDRKRVRRLRLPEEDLPKDQSNPYFDYDPNHCVLCNICVQTCEKIQGALHVIGRGIRTQIAFYGNNADCQSCMECVARCPVGALTAKESRSTHG
ncbi:2Fe-2S iron-sulfur cluster binding domain protein [delta proteobacterium NaphS2]|nr:2Fe-2S iron-sulfur cluster binding domain protein [delta proteobacterium NaphS2]